MYSGSCGRVCGQVKFTCIMDPLQSLQHTYIFVNMMYLLQCVSTRGSDISKSALAVFYLFPKKDTKTFGMAVREDVHYVQRVKKQYQFD